MILNATINDEIDENGPWWTASVHYARDAWKGEATADPAANESSVTS
jgi:hypothetical protein